MPLNQQIPAIKVRLAGLDCLKPWHDYPRPNHARLGACYEFIWQSPNIFKPAEIQHVETGGHKRLHSSEKHVPNQS